MDKEDEIRQLKTEAVKCEETIKNLQHQSQSSTEGTPEYRRQRKEELKNFIEHYGDQIRLLEEQKKSLVQSEKNFFSLIYTTDEHKRLEREIEEFMDLRVGARRKLLDLP